MLTANINIDIFKKSAIDNIINSSSELLSIALFVISQVSLFKIVMENNKCKCTQCLSQADKDTIISLDIDKLLADSEYFGKDMPDFKYELKPYSSDAFSESKNKFVHGVKEPLEMKSAMIKTNPAYKRKVSGQIKPKEPKKLKSMFECPIMKLDTGKLTVTDLLDTVQKYVKVSMLDLPGIYYVPADEIRELINESIAERKLEFTSNGSVDTLFVTIELDKQSLLAKAIKR